jgi:hypothetical protein
MILEKIKTDITDEFKNIKENLQIHLKTDFNISQGKVFLQTHVPNEVVHKSELLLDTLLNYLMSDARNRIETADTKFQNAFFDADFRKQIHEWAKQLENRISLDPDIVKYTSDPQLKQGLISSGVTLVLGTGVTYALNLSTVGTIVSGIVTILLSAYAFKIGHNKAAPKAREIIKNDIDQYLESSQIQVLDWLQKVEAAFEKNFQTFCSTNGFLLEKKK